MATPLNPQMLRPLNQDRYVSESEFLSPSTLPRFLAENLAKAWSGLYPDISLHGYKPKGEVSQPGIAWSIVRRTPGLERIDNHKPSRKGTAYYNQNQEVILLYTQLQTVTYSFEIYGNDENEVDEIVDAFEDFLYTIQGELQARGVVNFLFEEEISEDVMRSSTKKSEDLYTRVLRYTGYLHKKYILSYPMLNRIVIKGANNFIDTYDVAVRRNEDVLFDLIEDNLPSIVFSLTRVSSLSLAELKSTYINAEAVSGNFGTDYVSSTYLYLPEVDYQLVDYLDKDTGSIRKVIAWQNKPGAKRPEAGSIYYISYLKPVTQDTVTVQTGV